LGRAGSGPVQGVGPVLARPGKKREGPVGPRPAQPKGPGPDQLFGPDRPTDLINLINYYVLKKNQKNSKKIQKNFKKSFQKICDFLKYFPTKFA